MSWRSRKMALSATVGGALLALGVVATSWNKPVSLLPLLQGIKGDPQLRKRTDEPGEFEQRLSLGNDFQAVRQKRHWFESFWPKGSSPTLRWALQLKR
jgi:hypothetical protein